MSSLLVEIDVLAAACRGAIVVTRRDSIGDDGEEIVRVELGVRGGEWLAVAAGPNQVSVEFAGWTELLRWSTGDQEDREDAESLALDFVAAALFGELRVSEQRLAGRVLRTRLEVRVAGVWRVCASRGALGLRGAHAWVRGRIEARVRSNEGRLPRPPRLRDAGPSGVGRLPWSGAAMSAERQPAAVAIDGELDLHNFAPKEVGPLVREYIEVCRERGLADLRIVHGKGKGVLRRTVHAVLADHEAVESYRLGGQGEGSWGATIVRLRSR